METNNVKATVKSVRTFPRAMAVLCVTVSLSNLVLAPVVLYYIINARKSWSKSRHSRTYKYVNRAAGVTLVGIIITVVVIVTSLFVPGVFKGVDDKVTKNRNETTTTNHTATYRLNNTEQLQLMKVAAYSVTSQSNYRTHIGSAFEGRLPSATDVSKYYLNNTHILIVNRKTNTKKILDLTNSTFVNLNVGR